MKATLAVLLIVITAGSAAQVQLGLRTGGSRSLILQWGDGMRQRMDIGTYVHNL